MSASPTALTVAFATPCADAVRHREVLASLPLRWREVDGGADVAVVSGLDADAGAAEAAVAGGARALVLTSPGQLSLDALRRIEFVAAGSGALLVPALRYAPRLPAGCAAPQAVVVDIVLTTGEARPSRTGMLVEQLAALRRVAGAGISVRGLHRSPSHTVVEVALEGGRSGLLTALVSPTGVDALRVHAVGGDERWEIEIGDVDARPARVSRASPAGVHTATPVHQRSERITWLGLHELLTVGSGEQPYTFAELLHDRRLAEAVGDD